MSFSVRKLAGSLAAVFLGLTLASCTASSTGQFHSTLTVDGFTAAAAEVPESAWAVEMNTASGNPTVAGGVVLNFALDDENQLEIIALDAQSGKPLWKAPTSMGEQTQGTVFSPVVLTSEETLYAAYLTPAAVSETTGEFGNTIRIADIKTGEVITESPTAVIGGNWSACSTPDAFCAKVATPDGWNEASFTVEGDYTESTSYNPGLFSSDTVSRSMGNGIILLGNETQTTEIAYSRNGEVLTTYPLAQIAQILPFPVSQVVGETFTDSSEEFVGLTLLTNTQGDITDFTPALVISLNIENGEFNFSRADTLGCNLGAIMCSPVTGLASETDDASSQAQPGNILLHGVDLRTGEDTWSIEVQEFAQPIPPSPADAYKLPSGYHLISEQGTGKIISEATGEFIEPTAANLFLCTIPKSFPDSEEPLPEPDPLQAAGAHYAAACSLTELFENPSDFTEIVVRGGATSNLMLNNPQADDRFYVVQTDTQVLGYKL